MNIELNHHFNLGVILLYIWVFWVFLKQKDTRDESNYLLSSILYCAVALDRFVRFVHFLFSKDTWVRGIVYDD